MAASDHLNKAQAPTLFDDPGAAAPYNPELRAHIAERHAEAQRNPQKPYFAPQRKGIGDRDAEGFRKPGPVDVRTTDTLRAGGSWKQLPALMSARDIMSNYAPAEGDRMYHGTMVFANLAQVPVELGPDPRAGEATGRPARTDRVSNVRTGLSEHKKARLAAGYTQEDPGVERQYRRRQGVNLVAPRETDEQMWQRKLVEGQYKKRGGFKQSLEEHLRGGGDPGIIHLGLMKSPMTPPDERKTAKPMVAGSQHRIAVMNHINPDQLLPVMHHENIVHAKFEPEYT